MQNPTYGRLATYARRVGIPINDPLHDAQARLAEVQTAQGAAINGVYHPPVPPYEGHGEDALFQPFFDGNRIKPAMVWGTLLVLGVVGIVAATL